MNIISGWRIDDPYFTNEELEVHKRPIIYLSVKLISGEGKTGMLNVAARAGVPLGVIGKWERWWTPWKSFFLWVST